MAVFSLTFLKKIFAVLPLLLVLLPAAACNLLNPSTPPAAKTQLPAPADAVGAATSQTTPPPTSLPTTAPPVTATLPPTTATSQAAAPAPTVDFDDLSIYQPAMRPAFVDDIVQVAQAGASRYLIDMTLTTGPRPRLSGVEHIRYTNTEAEPLADIYFRLYPNLPGYGGQMDVERVLVNGRPVTPSLEAENSALRVPLPTPLPPGQTIDLTLFFESSIPTNPQVGYNIFSLTRNTAALAGFYPAIAVYDEAGWNTAIPPPYGDATYLDISLYQVRVTAPAEMIIATSGNQVERISNDDGTKTETFVSGPMRDFYLAANPDFQQISSQVDGITVNSFYPAGLAAGGRQALTDAVDALRLFNDIFGPYPYAELDVVATPTTAGGVEYPGIIVIAQRMYRQPEGFFKHVIGHEVAHQWWYGVVGNNQISEPWLDESLTNYSTAIFWEETDGGQAADKIIEQLFFSPYRQAQSQGQDRAVIGPTADFSASQYGTIVYGKGPLFFHALRTELGDALYFEAMQSYYLRYKYQLVEADDLINIIEETAGRSIQPLIETWLQGN